MKCELDANYHQCPFLKRETLDCVNPEKCSFQGRDVKVINHDSEKSEKWFEKYYK